MDIGHAEGPEHALRRLRTSSGALRALLLGLLCLWLPPAHTYAERAAGEVDGSPFLWRIDGPQPAYLFGTIHLPDPRLLPLAPAVQRAFDSADVVFTEIDLSSETQQRAMRQLVLSGDQTLRDVLPEALYERLGRYLAARGAPIAAVSRLKPWAVAVSLPQLAYAERFRRGELPLDQVLFENAVSAGKETAALETIEDQVAAMESQGREGEIAMLRETLDQLEEAERDGENLIEQLVQAYLSGDASRVIEVANAGMEDASETSRKLMERLIEGRNRTMAAEIRRALEERPDAVQLFAAGTLHFPGEAGIVELLRAAGYKVERVGGAPAR
jgi:uncharacterized protein